MIKKPSNKEFFNKHGIKNTKQRNLIYDTLKEVELPLTAEQVFFIVREFDMTISLSTVYRILDKSIDGVDQLIRFDMGEEFADV